MAKISLFLWLLLTNQKIDLGLYNYNTQKQYVPFIKDSKLFSNNKLCIFLLESKKHRANHFVLIKNCKKKSSVIGDL